MANRIQYRRDTAANWTAANPVLALGEPGWETDTKKRKVGDGTTAWASLSYQQAPPAAPFGTSPGVFDARRSLYNAGPEKFRKFRAALGKAATGKALCRVAHMGDSTSEGVGETSNRMANSWPGQLSQIFNTNGYTLDGSFGVLQAYTNNAGYWPEWVQTTGSWNALNGGSPVVSATASGAVLTFTSTNTGTVLELRYLHTGASFTYSLDGGAAQTVTTNGSQAVGLVQLTGLANTTHTIAITSTGNTQIFSAHVHSSITSGLQFWNAGIGSSKSSDWYGSNSWFAAPKLLSNWSPNLTTIMLGINDATNQVVTPANYQTNMQALITQALTTGDVLLISPVPASGVDLSQYMPLLYGLADSNNLPLLDMTHRWKDWTTQNAMAVYMDTYHPNGAGYNDVARAVYAALMG